MNLEKINLHFQTHLFSKDVETEQVGEVVNMITMMVFQEQAEGATKQTIDGLHIEGIRKRVPRGTFCLQKSESKKYTQKLLAMKKY